MSFPNSLAGTCYRCARYVGIGKGQLLKNQTPAGQLVANGHRYVVQCQACTDNPGRELPSATPTEASMSGPTVALYRQSLRKSILDLLRDPDMPTEKLRPGQQWLEQPGRTLDELHKLKDKLIDLRNTRRQRRLNQEALAA